MPNYPYKCDTCGYQIEVFFRMDEEKKGLACLNHDAEGRPCPGVMRRVFTPAGVLGKNGQVVKNGVVQPLRLISSRKVPESEMKPIDKRSLLGKTPEQIAWERRGGSKSIVVDGNRGRKDES